MPGGANGGKNGFHSGVRRDWTDLRDLPYVPSLRILKRSVALDRIARDAGGRGNLLAFPVRQQGRSGRCSGYALAALIDLQRRLQADDGDPVSNDEIVSADMLYHMAVFHDFGGRADVADAKNGSPPDGIRSLRSVVKGFYHHGVCLDLPSELADDERKKRWRSRCFTPECGEEEPEQTFPTVDQQKAARNIGLGAYFRVRPVLNDFHAALNDAGAILVSAVVHDGWYKPHDLDNKGCIGFDNVKELGAHAFVIVGYNENGFLVLNSWGEGWGGHSVSDRPTPGVALWEYADWARNILDAWVLRLGVSAPSAFDKSIGEQGTQRLYGEVRAGSTPCYELMGHYIHLDDGRHVRFGTYPSFPESWPKTRSYLDEQLDDAAGKPLAAAFATPESTPAKKYRGIFLTIPGSLEGIDTAFSIAAKRKNVVKDLSLYPYTVFWCAQFVAKSLEVLGFIFEECRKRAGEDRDTLDLMIEERIRGVGRAFWRDIELNARRAVTGVQGAAKRGDAGATLSVAALFDDIIRLCASQRAELHLLVEGAGALVLEALLEQLDEETRSRLPDALDSLSLVMPAIGLTMAPHTLDLIRAMNNGVPAERRRDVPEKIAAGLQPPSRGAAKSRPPPLPARIYIPSRELEKRVGFDAYGKTILHLVAQSFADRLDRDGKPTNDPEATPQTMLGMYSASKEKRPAPDPAFSRIRKVTDPRYRTGKVPQSALSADPALFQEVCASVLELRH